MTNNSSLSLGKTFHSRNWRSFGLKVVSPLFLAIINLFMVFIAIIFPPQLFSQAASEPDIVFLNSGYALLAIACTVSFISGIIFYRLLRGSDKIVFPKSPGFKPTDSLVRRIKIILNCCLGINVATIFLLMYRVGLHRLLRSLTDKTVALSVRNEILIVGRVAGLNILVFQTLALVTLVVAFFVLLNMKRPVSCWWFKFLFFCVAITYVVISFIAITRWPILQLAFSLLLIYVLYRNTMTGLGFGRVLKLGMLFIGFSLVIFLGIGLIKYGASHVIDSIIGYTMASYNLGAAVTSGIFHQPNSGSTFATFGFFWQFPLLGEYFRRIGIHYGLNLPIAGGANMTWVNAWAREIVQTTNLNPHWLWTTVYGYIYADIGWNALFIFFIYGAISQLLYDGFARLRLFHVALYSFFFIYQITWFTSVFISNTTLDDYIAFTLVIVLYIGPYWRSSVMTSQSSAAGYASDSA
jgi:hypothetical protein